MSIAKQAEALQKEIDKCMTKFSNLGKKAKELQDALKPIHLAMAHIVKELEPVDSLVRSQNPSMCELFDQLKLLLEERIDA